jgi:Protein kinase domain
MRNPNGPANPDMVTSEWSSDQAAPRGRAPDSRELLRWTTVLLHDQTERWRAGHRRPVEAYLDAYPQLSSFAEIGLALASREFVLRADRGESPQISEYRRRFPQWADLLESEIAFLLRHTHAVSPTDVDSSTDVQTPSPPPKAGLSWPRLPGYELLSELGRGGMAVVYHARQTGLNRPVAVKVILAGALAGQSDRERMRREAEAVARLRHPNAVQIYEIGEHDGCLFLTLEYMAGGSLDGRLSSHPIPPHDAAALVEQLAQAIQAAHDAGIIHRDLKPANVLLDRDGTPKVTDFGLAKQRDEVHRLTATGTAAGTPNYMAREQVLAEPENVGPATDVYGLGGILYECLTGRPPFSAPTVLETMRQVAEDEVVSVRRLQASVPRDLETVCLKCLEKNPVKRYATARDLAADLARFRAGEPVLARPIGFVERGWRWGRRNPLIPLFAITLGLMALSVGGLMAWSTYHAYQVAGQIRERELHLHGLRGTLMQLNESQARFAELTASTADLKWVDYYRHAVEEANRHRADAARLAPEATGSAGLLEIADDVHTREERAISLVRGGSAAGAWNLLQSPEHVRVRERYAASVGQFADRIDEDADRELRKIQSEAFWSLASATAVAGLIGVASIVVWLISVRRVRHGSNRPAEGA